MPEEGGDVVREEVLGLITGQCREEKDFQEQKRGNKIAQNEESHSVERRGKSQYFLTSP